MKRNLIFLLLASALFMNLSTLFSQGNQQNVQMLKPKVYVLDIVFAYQLLNSIELKGSEVNAFVEVKNVLTPHIETIQKENLPANNVVTFEIAAPVASNLLAFMERGKFSGADVEKYKRFVDSIIESAKPSDKK